MNRKLLVLLMVAIALPAAAAQYVKPGAELTLHPGQNNAEFNINASTEDGSGVCNMEGTAQQIPAGESQKRRWVWNDNTSQCVAVISELRNGKARRKEAGLTAADLAETIDISQQQLSRYERGTNKINIAHLVKIAVSLKTPISWFFIDCMEDLNVSDIPINYATGLDVELKQRLEQVWNKLDNTKRKSLIMFLDEFIK